MYGQGRRPTTFTWTFSNIHICRMCSIKLLTIYATRAKFFCKTPISRILVKSCWFEFSYVYLRFSVWGTIRILLPFRGSVYCHDQKFSALSLLWNPRNALLKSAFTDSHLYITIEYTHDWETAIVDNQPHLDLSPRHPSTLFKRSFTRFVLFVCFQSVLLTIIIITY